MGTSGERMEMEKGRILNRNVKRETTTRTLAVLHMIPARFNNTNTIFVPT